MKHSLGKLLLIMSAIVLWMHPNSARAQFDTNLIINPDAEQGTYLGLLNGFSRYSTPGWNTTAGFAAELYAEGGTNSINLTCPGPAERGDFYFAGANNPGETASQTLDVTSASSVIDRENAQFNLSGWLGGLTTQNDNASLTAVFRDSNGNSLSSSSIDPVLASDRNNVSGLFYRSNESIIPMGTRTINIILELTRTAGAFNNGVADNLSFKMHIVPAPSALLTALMGVSPIAVQLLRRRRK